MHFYDVLNVQSSHSTLVYTIPGTTLLYIAYSDVLAPYTVIWKRMEEFGEKRDEKREDD